MSKKLLSGNEAIARGAWEAGVKIAAAYPGTPSTEILETIAKYGEVYAEWAPNEKVAYEVAVGAAFAGKRSIYASKHVGLNVAADPFFTSSYTGIEGGFVVVTADDPGMHSSQNEQDNRNYARFAKVPLFEPSDSEEARIFTKMAFEMSEKYDTPVLLRVTTRVSHSKGLVNFEDRVEKVVENFPERKETKYVTIPAHAKPLRIRIEKRFKDLREFSENIEINFEEINDKRLGFIVSGISYQYIKDAFPEASVLKLGFTNPLPMTKIKNFVDKIEKVIIVEETDPIMETEIKANGINVHGKDIIPNMFELNTDIIYESVTGNKPQIIEVKEAPVRPPALCPGCPHRGVFTILRELGLRVVGDIGCYTLGVLPPLSALDWQVCMGAGISMVHGLEKAWDDENYNNIVGMVGDSTFFHSGITGLIDIVYNKGLGTIFILDNSTTAMTGTQDNPGTGKTLKGEITNHVSIRKIVEAAGVKDIYEVNPHDLDKLKKVVSEAVNKKEPSVIITKSPCVLLRYKAKEKFTPLTVNPEKCIGCKICLSVACPALGFDITNKKVFVHPELCTGCEVCSRLCPTSAFELNGEPLVYENKHKIRGN
ncbi:indolepyruvate ferredoxin oxidoreductase subunit alpha [bacterium]|nr:indolepyruvate ferredoxin oxidoreductase subunit alpha [bacterium]